MAKGRNRKGQFTKGGGGGGRKRRRHSTALATTHSTRVVHVKAAPRRRGRGGAALSTSHLWGPVLMGAALGFAKKQGWEIPVIGELGEDATIAVAGYAALKFNVVPAGFRKHVVNATLAAAVLAAHEIGQTGSIPGLKKKVSGAAGAGPQHNYEIK